MSTLAPQRPRHEPARPAPDLDGGTASDRRRLLAWALLFGALAAAAGHAVFFFSALRLTPEAPSDLTTQLVEVGRGRLGALALAWLLASPVLALAALVLRRALVRSRLLTPLAALIVLATAGAFAFYLFVVVRPS